MLNSQELKQYRFPKSKKKRIRAKWAKKICNFRYEDKYVCILNKETGAILVSTNVYEKYKKQAALESQQHVKLVDNSEIFKNVL